VTCTLASDTIRIEATRKPDPSTCVDTPAQPLPRIETPMVKIGPGRAITGAIPNFFGTWSLCSHNLVGTSTASTPYQLVAVTKSSIVSRPECVVLPGTPLPPSCLASPALSRSFTAPALDGCTCRSELVFFNTPVADEPNLANVTNCPTTDRVTLPSGSYYVTLTENFVVDEARQRLMPLPIEVFVP
jgi:hypothetical protein